MIVALLGEDLKSKDPVLHDLKHNHSAFASAAFDMDTWDANALDAATFKESLDALPTQATRRLIIIDTAHKLKPTCIEVITKYLNPLPTHVDVIFVSHAFELPAAVKKALGSQCKIQVFGQVPRKLFEITNALQAGDSVKALKELNFFLRDGVYSLNILGVLVWYWGKHGRRFGDKNFVMGWDLLQETDTHIKRSRMDPDMALEKAIVTLAQLQKNPR